VGLRAVGEVVHATYRGVAEARGLLSVEREFAEGLGQIAKGLGRALATVGDLRHTFVMLAVAGGEGVPVLHLYRQFRYIMALDIEASGAISPPGKDKGVVNVRLPVKEYDEDVEYDLDHYPVHEYHLLRILDALLQKNFSRSLEDLGLPTLRAYAVQRRQGAAESPTCSSCWRATFTQLLGQQRPSFAPTLQAQRQAQRQGQHGQLRLPRQCLPSWSSYVPRTSTTTRSCSLARACSAARGQPPGADWPRGRLFQRGGRGQGGRHLNCNVPDAQPRAECLCGQGLQVPAAPGGPQGGAQEPHAPALHSRQ
jgi:hypothetical protein